MATDTPATGANQAVAGRRGIAPRLSWLTAALLIWSVFVAGPATATVASPPIDINRTLFYAVYGQAYDSANDVITINPPTEHAFWSAADPKSGQGMGAGWYSILSGSIAEPAPKPGVYVPLYGKVSPREIEAGSFEVEKVVRFTSWGPCLAPSPGCRPADLKRTGKTAEPVGGLLELRIVMHGVLKSGVYITRHGTMFVGAAGAQAPSDAFAGVKVLIDDGPQFSINRTFANGRPVEGRYGADPIFGKGGEEPLGEGVAHFIRLNNTPLLAHFRGKPFQPRGPLTVSTVDEWNDVQSALLMLSADEGLVAETLKFVRPAAPAYAPRNGGPAHTVPISGPLSFVDLNKVYGRIPGEIPAVGTDNFWFAFYGNAWTKADGGKSIMFNRQGHSTARGLFNIKTGEIHAGGWYYMRDEKGVITEIGVWSATDLKAFDSFGQNLAPPLTGADKFRDPGPPANVQGPAANEEPKVRDAGMNARGSFLSGVYHADVDHAKETMIGIGGLAQFTAELRGVSTKDGATTVRHTTIYESCVDGLPPIWAWEGPKLPELDGQAYMVSKTVNSEGRRTPLYGNWPGDGFAGDSYAHNTPTYAHLVGKPYEPDNDAYLNIRTIEDWRLAQIVIIAGNNPPHGDFALIAGDKAAYPPKTRAAVDQTLGLVDEAKGLEGGLYCPPPSASGPSGPQAGTPTTP